jgi:polysaccharide deacetylase family protein (PEP-CTERM system associated)
MAMSSSPAQNQGDRTVNVMTVDVEDYFQVSAFEGHISRDRWDSFESRVCRNTERVLEVFDHVNIKATFFVLGWVAERFPALVQRISSGGHEVASHGYAHRLVYEQTPAEFRDDLRRAKTVLESASGQKVLGYRAPSYSITSRSMWAFDILVEEGYAYDASVYPIHHDRYGIPDAPRHMYRVSREKGSLWEMPGSTVRLGGQNLPIGGGGYFRILPYAWTRRGFLHVNNREAKPVMFYLHPWEIDPEQPRLHASLVSRFRHYRNLDKTERRLRRLVREFRFEPARAALSRVAQQGARAPQSSALALV